MGHSAPSSIQRRMLEISSGWSFLPGGIFSSPDCSMARTSKLSAGFPGLIAAPRLPPARMVSRLVSASPLVLVVSLWHGWQLVFRICRIAFPSAGAGCCANNADAVTSTKAAASVRRQNRPPRSMVTHYTLTNPRRWINGPRQQKSGCSDEAERACDRGRLAGRV